jgi:hypothetical protein
LGYTQSFGCMRYMLKLCNGDEILKLSKFHSELTPPPLYHAKFYI